MDPFILVRIQAQQHFDFVNAYGIDEGDGLERTQRVERAYQMVFTVYILRTSSNTLYIGQTNNLEKRLKEHKSKTTSSAKYMKYFTSFELVYTENYSTRKEAMQREWQLKHWTKVKKEALIAGDKMLLKNI